MNGIIYARYSSDNQREESIEGQLRECMEYAQRNDITIVGTYIDRALSARTADRPDFQRMIHDSEKHLFDVVIVWKLDRFSRDRYDSAHYKHILKKNGVRVVSAKEAIAEGPEGIILESMLEGMAEYYSAELAVKVRRGQKENAMKCMSNGGTVPLGYSIYKPEKKAGRLVVNPETAPIVQEIFSRYDRGEAIKDIVKDLNRRGLTNNFGRSFKASAFTNMLKNRKYIGEYRYGDTIVPGGVPAIIEKDLFERVQRRMEANRHAPARGKAKEEYLLATKAFCGTCGGSLVGECGQSRNGVVHHYYKCSTAKFQHTCKRRAIKKDWLEKAVVWVTVTRILTDDVIDHIADAIVSMQGVEDPIIPALREQIRQCENSLKNLLTAIEQGIITPTTKERMEELEAQRDKLNLSLIHAQMEQPVFSKEEIVKWISRFKYGNIDDRDYQREVIDTFLNAVYVYDDKIGFTYNFKEGTETVTLDELNFAMCSDMVDCTPPAKIDVFRHVDFLSQNSPGRRCKAGLPPAQDLPRYSLSLAFSTPECYNWHCRQSGRGRRSGKATFCLFCTHMRRPATSRKEVKITLGYARQRCKEMDKVLINRVYRHFKGDYYLVVGVAKHSETQEEMVVYRQLYGAGELWVRPMAMFLGEVDREKYPDAEQKYRFELQEIESAGHRR